MTLLPSLRRPLAFLFLAACPLLAGLTAPVLTIEKSSRSVKDIKLQLRSLSLQLDEGTAARIMEGDRPVGLYFKGSGTFRYISKERMEFAVMAFNLSKNSGWNSINAGDSENLNGDCKELFLLDAKAAEKLPPEAPGADLTADFLAFRKPFSQRTNAPLEHHLLLSRANAPGIPATWAEFRTSKGSFRHVVDPCQAVTESLDLMASLSGNPKGLVPVHVSEQPMGWDRRHPISSPAILVDVNLELEASKEEFVKVKAVETYRAMVPGLRVLALDLVNAHEDPAERPAKVKPYRLVAVKDAAGQALPFDHRAGQALVELPKALNEGDTVTLTFEAEGDLLYHPGGDNYWQLGVYAWFPMPSELDGQYFKLAARIAVPKPYTPFASGMTVGRESVGDLNVLKVKLDTPTQFFIAHAGNYRVKEETKDGVTVRIASYANESADPAKLFKLTFQILEFYRRALGPFPYPEFNIIQMNEWGYGQAPPATMLITNEAFQRAHEEDFVFYDEDGIPRAAEGFGRAMKKGVNFRFAHEIAHQYWGHVVKMPNSEEQWITESFSNMSALMAIRRFRTKGESAYEGQISAWQKRATEAAGASSIATANRLFTWPPVERSIKRQALIYDKGAFLLTDIQRRVGEGPFLNFLRVLLGTKGWNFATTQDVIDVLKATTKQDFTKLFDECYWGTAMPETVK